MTETASRNGYEKWRDGIEKATHDARWNAWDNEIRLAVAEYDRHLSATAGYRCLDWRLIKAMLWVETGASSPEWSRRPMQIGVPGDPGLTSLLTGDEGGDLILPPAMKRLLTVASARTNPAHNLRAVIGYLLMKSANYEYRSVPADDKTVYDIPVKPGDTLDRIARAHGSTPQMLRLLNPSAGVLRPGQVLKLQKASVQRVIVGCRPMSSGLIAQRYNGGRDLTYARKLDFALSQISEAKVRVCDVQ